VHRTLNESSETQIAVKIGGAAGTPVWIQRKSRDIANADPAQALIEPRGWPVGHRIEDEQRSASLQCHGFDLAHERLADSLPPDP
jgi:hypothetical protein